MNEFLIRLRANKKAIAALSASLGALAGAAASAAVAQKYFEKKYNEIAQEEIAEAKQFYKTLRKEDFPTVEEAAKELLPTELSDIGVSEEQSETLVEAVAALKSYGGHVLGPDPVIVEVKQEETMQVVASNVFTDAEIGNVEDFDPEGADRTGDQPYILKYEEFLEGRDGYAQIDCVWYEEDDVLTGDQDEIIADVEAFVGLQNLQKFGVGSGDANMVYVRNEHLELDMAISKSHRSYAQDMGFIQHSDSRKIPRFRGDDE